jgi:hypothetical protein
MDLSSLRDIVLIAWGLIASAATIYMVVVVARISRQTSSTMVSLNAAAERVKEIVDHVQEDVFVPVARIGSILRGINHGLAFIDNLFNKKEKK